MSVKNYKCINCGSGINFEPRSGKWHCDSCGSEFTKQDLDAFYDNKNDGVPDYSEHRDDSNIDVAYSENVDTENLNTYNCSNCGGEIIADDETVATFCPYCKSSAILKSRLSGEFNPRYLIPFKYDEKSAKDLYSKWIKKKIYTPKSFKEKETIDEIKGLYAPYWLYDMDISGGFNGTGTMVSTWSDSEYNYTKTDYYSISRGGNNSYKRVPADAATKLDDNMMNNIEPYNYDEITDFAMPYMSGFFAERYDLDANVCADQAKSKARTYFESRLKGTVLGYSSFSIIHQSYAFDSIKSSYAMLPIYYLANYYKKDKREFIINGQTGKIYGNPPISPLLLIKRFLILFAIFYVISMFVGVFIDA